MPMGMYISLLHRACMLKKLNCVKALIRGGCNIMAGDGTGPGIPFHLACCGYCWRSADRSPPESKRATWQGKKEKRPTGLQRFAGDQRPSGKTGLPEVHQRSP